MRWQSCPTPRGTAEPAATHLCSRSGSTGCSRSKDSKHRHAATRQLCRVAISVEPPSVPVYAPPLPREGQQDAADDWGRRDWQAAYTNCKEEPEGYWLPVEGQLPPELEGTFLRNGPGLFQLGGRTVAHPYDGHGIVASLSIRGGRAFFRSRFVQTAEYQEEQRQGSFLFPGSFGTAATSRGQISWPSLPTAVPKNAANTNVVPWNDVLLATFESGQPHALDPHTLRTLGTSSLHSTLRAGVPLQTPSRHLDSFLGCLLKRAASAKAVEHRLQLGGDALCSHLHSDPATGNTVFLRYRLRLQRRQEQQRGSQGGNPGQTRAHWLSHLRQRLDALVPRLVSCFTFCEFDQDGELAGERSLTVPGYAFVHDFAVTGRQYLLALNPVDLRLGALLRGASCVASVSGRPGEPLRWRILPRAVTGTRTPGALVAAAADRGSTEEPLEAAAESAFIFHHANAHESTDGTRLVVDSVAYPTFPGFFELGQPGYDFFRDVHPATSPISQLWRHTLCLRTGAVSQRLLSPRAAEFPAINPAFSGQQHRYIYAALALGEGAVNGPQQALGKLDTASGQTSSWTRGRQYFVGEPCFVARGDAGAEDAGWLLAMCYDAARHRSECVVLDAQHIAQGPVAVLPLRAVLPHGLHGCWHGTYLGPLSGRP